MAKEKQSSRLTTQHKESQGSIKAKISKTSKKANLLVPKAIKILWLEVMP